MPLNHMRFGRGPTLLLVHGLGGSWRSWTPVLMALAEHRELVVVDLPGFGASPRLAGEVSIRTLADALAAFIDQHQLHGTDALGSSLGARLVLELACRGGYVGAVVALDPGGFWLPGQRHVFYASMWLATRAARLMRPLLPWILRRGWGRKLVLAQLSARPQNVGPDLALAEIKGCISAPDFDRLLYRLAYVEPASHAPRGSIVKPLVIGWGRNDRICAPSQARPARQHFPDATLHWFEHCGHYPQWDAPDETVRLVLEATECAHDPPTRVAA